MIRTYEIRDSKITQCSGDTGNIIICANPDDESKRVLIDSYGIDEHTFSSALDPDELARLEFEPEHLAMIIKRPKNYSGVEQFLFSVSSYGIFWFKTKLVMVFPEDLDAFDGKIFNRVSSLEDVVLKMIYATIFHYLNHLRVINMVSDSLEQKINTSMKNEYLINLFTLEKSLVYYLNAINSNSIVISRIRQYSAKIGFSEESIETIDDIIIENNQCYKQAEIYSNILASLMDARVSIVSNNLNILMKTLNIITISIMVPTLVVSAFSMNVQIPMMHHPLAFWIIMSFAAFSVVIFMLFWRLKKW